MAVQNGVARDEYGNVLSGATITVYETGTSTLATLYTDSTLVTADTNPITADDLGEFVIYVQAGVYDITIAKPGFVSNTIEEVAISGASGDVNHGEAYISSASATAATTSYATVAGTFADGDLANFTRSSGVLTYTGPDTQHFLVTVVYSITSDTNNVVTEFALRKNGTSFLAKSVIQRKIGTGADVGAAALCSLVELETSDTLEVVCLVTSGTANLTVQKMNFSVVSVG